MEPILKSVKPNTNHSYNYVASDMVAGELGDLTVSTDEITALIDYITMLTSASAGYLVKSHSTSSMGSIAAHTHRTINSIIGMADPLRPLRGIIDHLPTDGLAVDNPHWIKGGVDPILCMMFHVQPNSHYFLALYFKARPLPEEMEEAEERVLAFLPLLKSYLRLRAQMDMLSSRLCGTTNVLNSGHVAVILLDNQGQIVFSNTAAEAILRIQDGFRPSGMGPMPVSLKDAARFQLALEHTIAENMRGEGRDDQKGAVLLINRENGRRPFVATLMPLETAASKPGDPAVALYLFDPSRDSPHLFEPICTLYGLSQVESRLAQNLAAGKTLTETASVMRIKAQTARTYLKQIFQKTGTHRQIDLIRLLIFSTGRLTGKTAPEALA